MNSDQVNQFKNKTPEQCFETQAIHPSHSIGKHSGALVPPVYMTSTFCFDDAEQGGALFAGEQQGHFYSRISNPTLELLEHQMAELEGAEAGLAFASGMGAICSVLWTLLQAGDEILVDKTVYGCTFAFLQKGLSKFAVKVIHVDMTDPLQVEQAINTNTRVLYFETPANPNMRLVDIQRVAEIAKSHDAITVVDSTYATPYLTKPIELGADIVVHSATKYLGGHGDLVAGLAAGSHELMQQIRLEGLKDMTGSVMAPLTAFHIMRGLKTLQLRMERHCQTAQTVAEALEQRPEIERVYYPGLQSCEQYELAQRQMRLPGGMIAFEMKAGYAAGCAMMNHLQMIKRAVSLGDAETLIQHPASMTHSTYTPEERLRHGISDGLVRLSIGLESAQDILTDLNRALDQTTMSHQLLATG